MNGELPYAKNSKWDYLKAFSYNQHYECAEELSKMIIEKYKTIK